MPMLRVSNLSAFYDRTQVLHEINVRVEEWEIVGLVGANGAGKTTTLLSIIGLKTRTEGEIWLNEERDNLPFFDSHVDLVQDLGAVIESRQVANAQHRHTFRRDRRR